MRVHGSMGWCLVGSMVIASRASAWGPDGHRTVGAIADRLIAGTHAATEVKALLGTLSLQDAAVWPDCTRGVDSKTFEYPHAGTFPECAIYETPAGEAAMIDFVKRNSTNCTPKLGEETCNKQYHYSDISIAHNHYADGFTGARIDDVAGAVVAATHVLKGDPAPAPFNFKDKKEALLVLVHYVGDIHQPLHVGAVYLNAKGKRVNPDAGTFDPATATHGGNQIKVTGSNDSLHKTWDAIPSSLTVSQVDGALLTVAKAVPPTAGPQDQWSRTWASESVKQARAAFSGIKFGGLTSGHWTTTLPAKYSAHTDPIKQKQLARAGARLAQLLEAIWP